ncbi:MAG: hypothetical protein LUD48_01805 [Prevotella sp.]|nr:hypothetical protein [Prevotella sp.]
MKKIPINPELHFCAVFSHIRLFQLLVTIPLMLTCVGAYADDYDSKITITWPFSATNNPDAEIPTVLTDYYIDNSENKNGHGYDKNDLVLVTTAEENAQSPYDVVTAISSGLTISGTETITALSSESNNVFTKFTVGSTTGTETIDIVISPDYEGFKLLPSSVSYEAFKGNGSSKDIQITDYLYWGTGSDFNADGNMGGQNKELSTLPTSTDISGVYKYSVSWDPTADSWFKDYIYNYYIPYGDIHILRLQIQNLNEGDEIYIGNIVMSFTVHLDGAHYYDRYDYNGVDEVSITHKAAKWYQKNIRYQEDFDFDDTFDEENMMDTLENNVALQAAHVYVDTIYMKKGTSIDLEIPGVKPAWGSTTGEPDDCAITNYFRWFNYRNDKNFYCGGTDIGDNGADLLIPSYNAENVTAWRFGNGYVSGVLREKILSNDNSKPDATTCTLRKVSFYYPKEDEFNESLSQLTNFDGQTDNSYYAVACDLSNYNDFSNGEYRATEGGSAFGLTEDATSEEDIKPQIYCEPTLMQRVLFYIVGIDDDMDEASDLPEDFRYYGNLFDEDYQGGTNEEGKKYLEEYEITFPSRHISDHTDDLVALSKDAQAYAIPGEDNPLKGELDIAFAEDNGLVFSTTVKTVDTYTYEVTTDYSTSETTTLTGANRVIHFSKKDATYGTQWSVDNNSTATILVTKKVSVNEEEKTYNIARYKLTFKDFAIPLTEPQVAVLDSITLDSIKEDEKSKYWWNGMTYRSKSYMAENYDLVNSLWFDYGTYTHDSYNSSTILAEATKAAVHDDPWTWSNQPYNYPFPLKWSNSSYAFYDGSLDVTFYSQPDYYAPSNGGTYAAQTTYCMYEIVNDYVGYGELEGGISPNTPQYSMVKNSGGSWLYVDASDRPGTVAELEFDEKLCKGSEVIATAWIKSDGTNDDLNDDAAVMFTIMGVIKNDDGTETHTPIYRQYSGQIRTTTYLSAFEDEKNLETQYTGKGNGTNEWFQLYMQFVNDEDVDYDYYTVRIDNCCASTEGGDFYLDEISVYVLHPTVEVAQIEPVCTDDDDDETNGYSPIRLDIDYESLMGCFGLDPDDYNSGETAEEGEEGEENTETAATDEARSLDFIIINKNKYDRCLLKNTADDDEEAVRKAIENSIVTLYYKEAVNGEGEAAPDTISTTTDYPTLSFHLNYDKNTLYDDNKTGENYPFDGYLYGRTLSSTASTGTRYLAVDFYADISAYTPYMIILQVHDDESEDDGDKLNSFVDWLANSYNCAIKTDFYLTSTTKIKLNGQVVDPTETLCKNMIVHVEPVGTYNTTGEGDEGDETHIIEGECFDWFIGYEEEFVAPNKNYGGKSLKNSLSDFRTIYPKAETLAGKYSVYGEDENNRSYSEDEDNIDPATGEPATVVDTVFTKEEYEMLQYYLEAGRLVLRQTYLDVHVRDTGITLVIQPIKIDSLVIEDSETMICFGYVPLVLSIDGVSPSLNMGFSDVAYPENYTPCLRLGLNQFKNATEDHPITVNLRGATYVAEEEDESDDGDGSDGVEGVKAFKGSKTKQNGAAKRDAVQVVDDEDEDEITDHLGKVEPIENDSVDYGVLYLIGTNDTAYSKTIAADNFGSYELAVGEIHRLYANENSTVSDPDAEENDIVYDIGSYMQIYFYKNIGDSIEGVPFDPKEGYYYSMTVHFEEKNAEGGTISLPCYGSFPLELKVVPEYLVWQGTSDSYNWNDDSNWKRADTCDIQKVDNTTWTYITNEQNTTDGGYVPMLFTKVVLPKDSKVQLYSAGYEKDADEIYTWEEDAPTEIYPMTDNIEYDMMVYNDSISSGDNAGKTEYLTTKHYRVNLCDEIHLEDGAQLLHAELLMYNKAWIDVSIPTSQWTLVSLPLKDIYAGDWYTKQSGTETSEYFTDLTFSGDNADRSNPLVYQRSWDSKATIVEVTTDDEGNITGGSGSSINSYSSTGWSSVYNDGAVPYSAGSGFSVKVYQKSSEDNDGSGNVLFRFPKYDVKYTTTYSDTLSKENYGKLWLSDMVTRTITMPDGDSEITYAELDTLRMLTKPTAEGYCLIGNPFTASMSLAKFLEVNKDCISSYWFEDKKGTDGPIAGNRESTSDGVSEKLLPAYSAFFVQVDETLVDSLMENGLTVMFTEDMQSDTLVTIEDDYEMFSIRAANSNGRSSAAFAYSDKATDGYNANEDAILLEDASWKRSGMPLVYTVAGNKAVSVNSLKDLRVIPLGVFADEGSTYTLTFVGVDNVAEPVLYDAELNTETPINEGFTMTLTGATHGRYFIRTNGKASTDIQEVTEQKSTVSVYSPTSRTIVVSSDAEIKTVEVYNINGNLLKRATVDGISCTLYNINCDIAIVKVSTEEGSHVSKIRVKK